MTRPILIPAAPPQAYDYPPACVIALLVLMALCVLGIWKFLELVGEMP